MKQLFSSFEKFLFYFLIFLLPTQLGLHFWPDFSKISGIRIDYLSPTVYFTDVLIIMLFGVWMSKKFPILKKSLIHNYLFIILVIFLIFNILLSSFIPGGFYFLWKFLEMSFLVFYIRDKEKTEMQIRNFILILFGSAVVQSVIAIIQFVKQGSVGGILYFLGERTFTGSTPGIANASVGGELVLRPYGTFPHPNVLAGFLLIVVMVEVFLLIKHNNQKTRSKKQEFISSLWLTVCCLIISSVALFLTMSRIAIGFLILVLGSWFIARFRKTKHRIVGVVLFALVILFGLSTSIGARFVEFSLGDESVVQRQILAEKSMEMIRANFLFGVGLGNFIPTLSTLQNRLMVGTQLQPVHNIFLLVFAETGVVGFGFFIYFLGKTFEHVLKRRQMLFVGLLTVILTIGLFDHYFLTLQQGQLILALVLGLCWSRIRDDKV